MTDEALGPAMAALDERRRAFVWALLTQEKPDQGKAAEAAGFAPLETSRAKDRNLVLRVRGSNLIHEPRVQAAILEIGGKELVGLVLPSLRAMAKMVRDPKSKGHRNAVETVLDRAGLGATQRIAVDHTHRDLTGPAMLEEIARLAAKHGLDPARLLGNAAPAIEGEFQEVKAE